MTLKSHDFIKYLLPFDVKHKQEEMMRVGGSVYLCVT